MKNIAYVLVALAAASSVARAEPAVTQTAPAPPAPASYYVAAGAVAGLDTTELFDAASVEGGYRLARTPLWVHGMVVDGEGRGLWKDVSANAYLQVRGGLEVRSCSRREHVCGVVGLDVGYAHELLMTDAGDYKFDGVQAIPRAMLDLGGKHLRVRPGLEAFVDRNGFDGIGATGALAYVW